MANELTGLFSRLDSVIRDPANTRAALTSVLAIHKPRIFESGEDRTGNKIGKYGTKKISISRKNQARDTGHTYFKGGYDQYKQEIGKNPGFVNLRNTDQMMGDYGLTGDGEEFFYGFQNEENYNKSQWMEAKYEKEIFDPSDSELDRLAFILEKTIESKL